MNNTRQKWARQFFFGSPWKALITVCVVAILLFTGVITKLINDVVGMFFSTAVEVLVLALIFLLIWRGFFGSKRSS